MKGITWQQTQDVERAFPKLAELVRSKDIDVIHIDISAFEGKEGVVYPTLVYIVTRGKSAEVFLP